jgi:bifunctional oligoribonuclease and PAP phosphatase NrnA
MSALLNDDKIESIGKIIELFKKNEKFIITTHVNPDGDAIGSVLALHHYLKYFNKSSRLIIYSPVPYNLRFLKGSEEINIFEPQDEKYILESDVAVVVDLNDATRAKEPGELILKSDAKKVIIDHHINPKDFADFYLTDEDATSAGELIYFLLSSDEDYKISKSVAECLYTAIMTDTGSFRFPRTDGNLHRIVADLIDLGADPVYLFENIYNIMPVRVVKLLGQAFKSIELFYEGKVCVMTLRRRDFEEIGAVNEDVEDIVEKSMAIEGVVIGILLSEHTSKEEIRVSFRSKGDISVRDIAVEFNGGGHKNAAGARFFNTAVDDAKNEIIKAIESFI